MIPTATPVASFAPGASLHRFDAYRLALAFRTHVVRWLPLKRAELSDQLDRASISRTGRDQARHYVIARGSAFESLRPHIERIPGRHNDGCQGLEEQPVPRGSRSTRSRTAPVESQQARTILVRLMAVLTALIRR